MDPEDENQDAQDINEATEESRKTSKGLFDKLRRAAKNDFFNKLKKMIVPVILPVVLKLMIPLIILSIILLFASNISDWFIDLFGNDNVSSLASAEVIADADIKKGENGYYFEISQDLVDKYIKELNEAYKNGNFYLDDEENEEILKEYGLHKDENGEIVKDEDEGEEQEEQEQQEENTTETQSANDEFTNEDLQDWFSSDEFEDYFVRMLRAEIASSYPKIGTEGSVGKGCKIENDRPNGEIINPKKGDNYIAQGIIQVRRQLLEDVPDTQVGPSEFAGNLLDVDSVISLIADTTDPKVEANCDGNYMTLGNAIFLGYVKQEGPEWNDENTECKVRFYFDNIQDTFEVILKTYQGYVVSGEVRIVDDSTGAFRFPKNKDGKREIDVIFDNIKQNLENAGGIIENNTSVLPQEDTSVEMTYLPYEEFQALKANPKDKSILKYFSFDQEKGLIYYYTYSGAENGTTFTEASVRYKTLVNMCSMPYNFLFALLQTTNDPEWVMAVVDQLLLESEAVILIQDQKTITTTTNTYSYLQKTETGNPTYPYDSYSETTTTVQYSSRADITKAHTWCIDYEQKPTLVQEVNAPSKTNYDPGNLGNYEYTKDSDNGENYKSTESYLSSTTTTITSITCKFDVIQEKEISTKFLSTWKNKTGKYELGQEYDQEGKEIKYKFPYRSKATSIPPDTLHDMSEYGIDLVLDLLSRHEDTQLQEQLMMYYWNLYTGDDVYDIDLEALLELFESKTAFSGSLIANFIKAHENPELWKYTTGQTSQIPSRFVTSDGQNYIVFEDGSAGRHNVSYGLATFQLSNNNSTECPVCKRRGYYNWVDQFAKYGINVKELCTGSKVPIDAADNVFEDAVAWTREQVEAYIEKYIPDAELTSAQIDCLTSIRYNRRKYSWL